MKLQLHFSSKPRENLAVLGALKTRRALAFVVVFGCVFAGARGALSPTKTLAQAPQAPQWNALTRADPAVKMGVLDLAKLSYWVQANAPETKGKTTLAAHFPALEANIESAVKTLNRASVKSAVTKEKNQPGKLATARDSAGVYAVLNLEFDSEAAAKAYAPGADSKVFCQFQKWVDVFVPASQEAIVATLDARGLTWAEVAETGVQPPPPTIETGGKSKGIADGIVQGGRAGLTGKNVVIAVVDSGIDFHHPDFVSYDKNGVPTSRIVAFWDTTSGGANAGVGSAAPIAYPNGTSVGRVYSQADLTAELRGGRARIASWDSNGHGTACAGIAAGNGNAADGKNKGVAPDAQIIAVRIGGQGEGLENSYLLNAICAWVDAKAGAMPAVVSCSFGGQGGGADGQRIEERQLSARFAPNVKGRALCVAAGNEGEGDVVRLNQTLDPQAANGEGTQMKFQSNGGPVWIYLDTDDIDGLQLGLSEDADVAEEDRAQLLPVSTNPFTGQSLITLLTGEGVKQLNLRNNGKKPIQADILLADGLFGQSKNLETSIGTPGSTLNAITVGSYDWNDTIEQFGRPVSVSQQTLRGLTSLQIGNLSSYSSRGPLRTGENKPEIVAPGQFFVAPYSANSEESYDSSRGTIYNRDSSGFYRFFNGTSAATPYVSGVVALLLQKNPGLTAGQIKALLQSGATHDQNTGDVPNANWGNGKLDVAAVDKMIAAVPGK